jgi:hypothetical protein
MSTKAQSLFARFGMSCNVAPPPLRRKSTKIERKTTYKLSSIGRGYYRYREKSRQGPTRYRVFLQRKYLDSIREHSELLSR